MSVTEGGRPEQMQPDELEGNELPLGALAGDETPAGERRGMHPGDEVPPDAPGAGENFCRACGGSGRRGSEPCPICGGTGKVYEAVSGGP